jgi:ABC-type Fe3+/spermidine/putrescine transport system ATPase subunit
VSNSRSLLEVTDLSAQWGNEPVLRDLRFSVGEAEFLVLLGPNGSGKTTLLRCLVGLETPTAGEIRLDGVDLRHVPTHRRGIGLMFQEPALFPHRTVYENVAYGPLLQRRPRTEVDREVGEMVDLLHLAGLVDRRPEQLSGGERQRVALARTLAARPRLVLLDEPFASIDVELKAELHAQFRSALRARGTAAIHVTHDRAEGLFLGDRVGLLFDGTLEAIGPPTDIYERPRSARAARFLGYNLIEGASGPEAVRAEDLRVGESADAGLRAIVVAAGTLGRESLVIVETESGARLEAVTEERPELFPPGRRVGVSWSRSIRDLR